VTGNGWKTVYSRCRSRARSAFRKRNHPVEIRLASLVKTGKMPNMSKKSSGFAALGIAFALATFSLSGCVTGEKMHQVSPGMTQSEVIRILGKPDGFRSVKDYEWFQYSHRLATGWAWDRADYNVIFKNGRVVEYGTGEVRVKQNTVVIVPLVNR
jgi:SmpA / OmlA family